MSFVLGNQTIVTPNKFVPPKTRIGYEDTASDGTLKVDMIAVKKGFTLIWDYLISTEYAVLDALFEASATVSFEYPDDNQVQQTVTVWISSLDPGSRTMPELYRGVTMKLREV